MADEVIILDQEALVVNISGRPIEAFPDTGTIVLLTPTSPDAVAVPGLNRTLAIALKNVHVYTMAVTVMPKSSDSAFFSAARRVVRETRRPLSASVTYEGTQYISGAVVVQDTPPAQFDADTVTPEVWTFVGSFPIALRTAFSIPSALTADEITG
jgi:hypothetical protein